MRLYPHRPILFEMTKRQRWALQTAPAALALSLLLRSPAAHPDEPEAPAAAVCKAQRCSFVISNEIGRLTCGRISCPPEV